MQRSYAFVDLSRRGFQDIGADGGDTAGAAGQMYFPVPGDTASGVADFFRFDIGLGIGGRQDFTCEQYIARADVLVFGFEAAEDQEIGSDEIRLVVWLQKIFVSMPTCQQCPARRVISSRAFRRSADQNVPVYC